MNRFSSAAAQVSQIVDQFVEFLGYGSLNSDCLSDSEVFTYRVSGPKFDCALKIIPTSLQSESLVSGRIDLIRELHHRQPGFFPKLLTRDGESVWRYPVGHEHDSYLVYGLEWINDPQPNDGYSSPSIRRHSEILAFLHNSHASLSNSTVCKLGTLDLQELRKFFCGVMLLPQMICNELLGCFDIFQEYLQLKESSLSFGVIHGDPILPNFVGSSNKCKIIDFDDCSQFYFLYDVAVYVFFLESQNEAKSKTREFLSFYSELTSTIVNKDAIEGFIGIHCLVLIRRLVRTAEHPGISARAPKVIARLIERVIQSAKSTRIRTQQDGAGQPATRSESK